MDLWHIPPLGPAVDLDQVLTQQRADVDQLQFHPVPPVHPGDVNQ